jgi:hypothetical protein
LQSRWSLLCTPLFLTAIHCKCERLLQEFFFDTVADRRNVPVEQDAKHDIIFAFVLCWQLGHNIIGFGACFESSTRSNLSVHAARWRSECKESQVLNLKQKIVGMCMTLVKSWIASEDFLYSGIYNYSAEPGQSPRPHRDACRPNRSLLCRPGNLKSSSFGVASVAPGAFKLIGTPESSPILARCPGQSAPADWAAHGLHNRSPDYTVVSAR